MVRLARALELYQRQVARFPHRSPTEKDKGNPMAAPVVPHLCNDNGVEKIYIGVKEFQCMGARAPMDHPHIFLDMGADSQVLCPYCSTLYIHDARLGPTESEPPACIDSGPSEARHKHD